jgi:DNA repair protein SbcD/Mre11
LHVRGSEVHSLYKMTEREDILFSFADLNPSWAYVALGHIHKPQILGGAENVRYPGSLDQLDFGDTHGDYGVMLVDINGGEAVHPMRLPLTATPFHTITIQNPDEELSKLASQYPDHLSSIARFRISRRGMLGQDEITREVRKLFPRWHEIIWETADKPAESRSTTQFTTKTSLETTVREYVTAQSSQDSDKAELLQLLETFLKPEAKS